MMRIMKIKGLKIILNEKDNSSLEAFDLVLRKFKRQVKKFGLIQELRNRMYFVKPSEKRHRIKTQHKKRK